MVQKFKIYEFDERTDLNDTSGNYIIQVKVSTKAEKLSRKAQKLSFQHNQAIKELIRELEKHNPDVDFNDFMHDDFGFFTGELIS